jgi:rhodanese-related sulfurtransferase
MNIKIITIASLIITSSLFSGCTQKERSVSSKPVAEATPRVASNIITNLSSKIIIDVRTPEEFNDGHLQGAINIDINSSDFDLRIKTLDITDSYILYCRSGNRSALAADQMRSVGILKIEDLGSLEQASIATGLKIVR